MPLASTENAAAGIGHTFHGVPHGSGPSFTSRDIWARHEEPVDLSATPRRFRDLVGSIPCPCRELPGVNTARRRQTPGSRSTAGPYRPGATCLHSPRRPLPFIVHRPLPLPPLHFFAILH